MLLTFILASSLLGSSKVVYGGTLPISVLTLSTPGQSCQAMVMTSTSTGGLTGGSVTPTTGGLTEGSVIPTTGGSTGGSVTPTTGGSTGGSVTPTTGGSTGGSVTPTTGGLTGGFVTPTTDALIPTTTISPSDISSLVVKATSAPSVTLSVSPTGTAGLQFAQYIKNLEVSFFASGLQNVNSLAPNGSYRSNLANVLGNITAQETIHQTKLKSILTSESAVNILPCQYTFSSTNLIQFVFLSNIIKSIEIGSYIYITESLATSDPQLVPILTSIATVAARQDATLRAAANYNPSLATFDTPIPDVWAYNLAQEFIKPGSCPTELPIPILPNLYLSNMTAGIAEPGQNVTFSWDVTQRPIALEASKPLFIGWANQINPPVYTPLTQVRKGSGNTTVPMGMSGIAFAVLTAQPDLGSLDELTEATLAGPVVVSLLN